MFFKKKAGSRSVFTADPKSSKRQKIDAVERGEQIASLKTKINEINKHITTKQNLISRANSTKDYFLCDKVQKEMRELLQEKEKFENELKVFQKKDARSRCYKKSKERKQPSKTMVSESPLPPKDVQSVDIRTLFARKSAGPLTAPDMSSTNAAQTTTSSIENGSADSPIIPCADSNVETGNNTNDISCSGEIEISDNSIDWTDGRPDGKENKMIDENQDDGVARDSHAENRKDKETLEDDINNKEAYVDDKDNKEICEDSTDNKETHEDENHLSTSHISEESVNEPKDNDVNALADCTGDSFLV